MYAYFNSIIYDRVSFAQNLIMNVSVLYNLLLYLTSCERKRGCVANHKHKVYVCISHKIMHFIIVYIKLRATILLLLPN